MKIKVPMPINFQRLAERAEARELRARRIDAGHLQQPVFSCKLPTNSRSRGLLARLWAR